MGNSIDKEINDLLWRLEYIGKYTSKMREEKTIEITKLTVVEKLDAIYNFKQEISNYEKNKKSIMDKIIDRELGYKLLDRLYNSGNLSLNEVGDKRDELKELKEDQIDDFINGLPNAKHFLSELTRSKEQTEFNGVFERKWMKDKKSRSDKNIDGFVNTFFFGHFNKTARAFIWWLIGTYTTFRIYSVIIRLANGDSPADKFVEYTVFLIFFMSLSFITYKIKSFKKWLFKLIPSDHVKWDSFKLSLNNNERISLSLLFGYFFFNLFLLITGGTSYECYEEIWLIETDFKDIRSYDVTDFLLFNFIPCVIYYAYFSLKPKP
ncbi:MAG: hypothetical protein P8H64_05325 [Flavobacteriaceae bacterium]|nr:hypothetical protein [Flavobacteriaceae bacterium]